MALDLDTLFAYLRLPQDNATDIIAAGLITDLVNGVVEEVTGVLDPEPARVQAIRLEVAARAIRNPEGLTSETIDDYTWRAQPARAGVYLTLDERQELIALKSGNPDPAPWAGSMAYRR